MNYTEFFLFASENILSLLLITSATVFIYLLIYKKYIKTVFDPFFLITLVAGLSASTVFYLYYHDLIKKIYFFDFLITEISFIIGFLLIKPINFDEYKNKYIPASKNIFSDRFNDILLYVSSISHVALQVLTYLVVGIPILLESRMSVYSGGSGFGVVGRIIDVVGIVGPILAIHKIFYLNNNQKTKIYNYTYLLLVLIFMLISGNKTNLVYFVYYIFFVNLYMLKIKGKQALSTIDKTIKLQKTLFISSIPLIFLVMYVQYINSGGESFNRPLIALGQRIISFGDIYYMTLPNEVIKFMDSSSGFMQLFKDPLGMLRIYPWDELPLDCGIEIYNFHYSNGNLTGPNTRYNYFSILYFNEIGQIIYCFILGIITSFLRNSLYRILPNNIIFGAIYALFSFNLIYIFQDQAFTLAKFINIIIFIPILITISLAIEYITIKNK